MDQRRGEAIRIVLIVGKGAPRGGAEYLCAGFEKGEVEGSGEGAGVVFLHVVASGGIVSS